METLTTPEVIATASVVIAVLSFIATFWQAAINRKHNRLSVKPYLDHGHNRILGKDISLQIQNHGLGPAIISKFAFVVGNSRFYTPQEFINHLCVEIQREPIGFECSNFVNETILAPGCVLKIFEIEPKLSDIAVYHKIFPILEMTELLIGYRSIYDESFAYKASLRIA